MCNFSCFFLRIHFFALITWIQHSSDFQKSLTLKVLSEFVRFHNVDRSFCATFPWCFNLKYWISVFPPLLNIRVPSTIEYPCFLHYWKSVFPPLLNIRVSSTIEYPCSLHYWISKYCRRNLLMNLNIWKINDYLEMYYSIFKNIYTTVVSVKL